MAVQGEVKQGQLRGEGLEAAAGIGEPFPSPNALARAPFGLLLVRGKFLDGFLNAKEFLGSTCPALIGGASHEIQILTGYWAFITVLVTNDKSVKKKKKTHGSDI